MLIAFFAVVLLAPFLPFVFVAARRSRQDQRMRVRFAMLQAGGAGGLSSGKQQELLKKAEAESKGSQRMIGRLSGWLQLDLLLLRANSRQTPSALLRSCGLLAVAVAFSAFFAFHASVPALLLGSAAGLIPWLWLRTRARQRTVALEKVLPQVLDILSRALRAGHSLPAALGIVAEGASEPARTAFLDVFQKQKFGLPLRDALLELVRCFPSHDLKVLTTAILVQRDTGGNLVQVLERTAAVIRERLKLQGDIRVHTAQGRMTGWILCLLPVLMLGLLMVSNPGYPKILFADPLGRKLVYVGVGLLAVGVFVIQRIVKGIEV